jgi:hypothetical protein
MNPLAIILVIAFFGSLVFLGAILTTLGIRRLQRRVSSSNTAAPAIVSVSLDIIITALGLLFAFGGAISTYRIVWGA